MPRPDRCRNGGNALGYLKQTGTIKEMALSQLERRLFYAGNFIRIRII
jgi:hypothetical protein